MTSTTAVQRSTRGAAAARSGPLAAWRAASQHPLLGFYLARQRVRVPLPLARRAALIIWALLIAGTALGVAAYPDAVNVECDWFGCYYPYMQGVALLNGLNTLVAMSAMGILCLIPLFGPIVIVIHALVIKPRRQQGRRSHAAGSLEPIWSSGIAELLVIAPVGMSTLVRIRLLARLRAAWRQRWLLLAGYGVVVALVIANHVLRPTYWWLGPWGQWLAQLGVAALWGLAFTALLAALIAHGLVLEVSSQVQSSMFGSAWSGLGMGLLLAMLGVPFWLGHVVFTAAGHMSYHDANTLNTVLAPSAVLISSLLFIPINTWIAQGVLHLRLRLHDIQA